MPKGKTPNVRDDFEDVLLYTSGYEKVRDKIDESLLLDPEFCRVVRYMTSYFCRKNRGFLDALGYDERDIHTVIAIRALRFMAMDYEAKDDRARYMFLMRHLEQRFSRFRDLLERKHSMRDMIMIGVQDISWFPSVSEEESSGPDLDELKDDYATLRAEVTRMGREISECPNLERRKDLRLERAAVIVDVKDTASDIRNVHSKRRAERSENQRITEALKVKLEQLPREELEAKMSYYATLRSVSKEVRTSARAFCRQHGIDYSAWAKKYIERNNFDDSEFVL